MVPAWLTFRVKLPAGVGDGPGFAAVRAPIAVDVDEQGCAGDIAVGDDAIERVDDAARVRTLEPADVSASMNPPLVMVRV